MLFLFMAASLTVDVGEVCLFSDRLGASPVFEGDRLDSTQIHISGGREAKARPSYAITSPVPGAYRFEIRNTSRDRSEKDRGAVRRAEIAIDRIPLENGIVYWDSFTITPEAYARPGSLAETNGGLFAQVKMSEKGSPVLGFRRTRDDQLMISARSADKSGIGTILYKSKWQLGSPHRFIRKMVFGATQGSLDVWLDGIKIISAQDIGVGGGAGARYYLKFGAYYPGGIGSDRCSSVVNYISDIVLPRSNSIEID